MFMGNLQFYKIYEPMFVHVYDYSCGSYRLVTPTREAIWNIIQKSAQTTKVQRRSFAQALPHSMSMVMYVGPVCKVLSLSAWRLRD